ncbi:hypothetical protein DSM110093_02348 [Sulfitobacter sp. DSM 110093]|nr:hypothetical protein DSM110093_02348 [Sulfitobacter sp. DSM 110093]
MEGVKQSGRSACIHALVQFPTGLLDGSDEEHQRAMLHHAVKFLNHYHGGDAVFAARLDRDERGRHTVDAFLLPRYDFHYKDGRRVKKASVSKFSKAHAKQRFGRDDRRSQGSALQDAFFEHLRDNMQLHGVMPPERKKSTTKDRVEPEVFGLREDRQKLHETSRRLVNADRVAQQHIKGQAAENEAKARLIARKEAALKSAQEQLAAERSAYEEASTKRSLVLDQREAVVRRDAKTVRNVRILSGQGVSRSLNRILDAAFESQEER